MRPAPTAFAALLALGVAASARAAICPEQARLAADPRWTHLGDDNCDLCEFNRVRVGPGARLLWNRNAVSEAKLAGYLGIVAGLNPIPVTLLVIDGGADCALLARVAAIETHADCGPGEYCRFGLAEDPPPLRRRRR